MRVTAKEIRTLARHGYYPPEPGRYAVGMHGQVQGNGSRFRFSLRTLLVVFALVGAAIAFGPEFVARWSVRQLRNKDLVVSPTIGANATYLGLTPRLETPAAKRIELLGTWANPALERALADPERFAAAHVMLTRVNPAAPQISPSHWNHMQLRRFGRGKTDFYPEQREQLQALWRQRLHGK